jgi:hypothetical protein
MIVGTAMGYQDDEAVWNGTTYGAPWDIVIRFHNLTKEQYEITRKQAKDNE